MKIELKKLQINEKFSQETTMFMADLFINGYKAGYCRNDGHGGETYYTAYDKKGVELIGQAEAYCKTLPDVKVSDDFSYPMDLESFIDEIVHKKLDEKFLKKLEKDMDRGVVFGNKNAYGIVSWKKHTISSLLAIPTGRQAIKKVLDDLKNRGETILNTNIPQELM